MSRVFSASFPHLSLVHTLSVAIWSGRGHKRMLRSPLVVVFLRHGTLLPLFSKKTCSWFLANMHTGQAERRSGLLPLKDERCIVAGLVGVIMWMSNVLLFCHVVPCCRDAITVLNMACGQQLRKGLLSLRYSVFEDMGSGNNVSVWISCAKGRLLV